MQMKAQNDWAAADAADVRAAGTLQKMLLVWTVARELALRSCTCHPSHAGTRPVCRARRLDP
jgi:hypothetical protein